MKYFYIHGLNSNGISTAKKLSALLDTDVKILDWNCSKKFSDNVELLKNTLEQEKDDFILIGSSLGGFYANYLANIYEVPSVLFNPVINPIESLENIKDNEFYKNLPIDEIINSYDIQIQNKILPRVIVVGLNDKIINPTKTIELWKNKCNLIITDENHQIEDFTKFKDDILHLHTPLFYDINEFFG